MQLRAQQCAGMIINLQQKLYQNLSVCQLCLTSRWRDSCRDQYGTKKLVYCHYVLNVNVTYFVIADV